MNLLYFTVNSFFILTFTYLFTQREREIYTQKKPIVSHPLYMYVHLQIIFFVQIYYSRDNRISNKANFVENNINIYCLKFYRKYRIKWRNFNRMTKWCLPIASNVQLFLETFQLFLAYFQFFFRNWITSSYSKIKIFWGTRRPFFSH